MSALFETGLSFLLFLPTFLIVAALYCAFPRRPRGALRWLFDLGVLALAALLSILAMRWGFHGSSGKGGAMWKQVVATLYAYGAFLGVLCVALPLRALWLRGRRSRQA